MTKYAWPGWGVKNFELRLLPNVRTFVGSYSPTIDVNDLLGECWIARLRLTPETDNAEIAAREAYFDRLKGPAHTIEMPHLKHSVPYGTMRGEPTLQASVAQLSNTAVLQNCRAGSNLLRSVDYVATWLGSGWTAINSTVTQNAIAGPDGTTTAWTLTRTAAGNHYALAGSAIGVTADRTYTGTVWLKRGTLTGNVTLRLRDGATTEFAAVSVNPTTDWAPYRVSGRFGSSSAADVVLYIDPDNNAGSAGDTLHVWYSDIRSATGVDQNCVSWEGFLPPPAGMEGFATEVRRSSASNAYTAWFYPTTAHANKTFTFSCWLQTGTYTGGHVLYLRDGSGFNVGTSVVTTTAGWQRWSVTGTFGSNPAATIVAIIDPNDGGSVGETYGLYGVMLNEGSSPGTYHPYATLKAGDMIGINGQLLRIMQDATSDIAGNLPIEFLPRARSAWASSLPVTWASPKAEFRLKASDGVPTVWGIGSAEGPDIELIEAL